MYTIQNKSVILWTKAVLTGSDCCCPPKATTSIAYSPPGISGAIRIIVFSQSIGIPRETFPVNGSRVINWMRNRLTRLEVGGVHDTTVSLGAVTLACRFVTGSGPRNHFYHHTSKKLDLKRRTTWYKRSSVLLIWQVIDDYCDIKQSIWWKIGEYWRRIIDRREALLPWRTGLRRWS